MFARVRRRGVGIQCAAEVAESIWKCSRAPRHECWRQMTNRRAEAGMVALIVRAMYGGASIIYIRVCGARRKSFIKEVVINRLSPALIRKVYLYFV